MVEVTDEELLKLWKDPHFEGSFRGIKAFQTILKTNLQIDVSERRLRHIFKSDRLYLIHQKKHKVLRRHFDLNVIGEVVQADIAYMYDYEGFKYFLLVVDCFSSKLFVEPLKNKDSNSVTNAFKKFFNFFKSKVYKLESDRGSEFKGSTAALFKEKKIYYKAKFGQNKASYAEHYIYIVKRKLYMLLRSELSKNWPKYIKLVVDGYNKTPLEKLGFLTPNDISGEKDSVAIQENKKAHNISTYRQPNFEEQIQNALNLKTKLKKGDFCYKFFDEKLFNKKYNISVSDLSYFTYKICDIFSYKTVFQSFR